MSPRRTTKAVTYWIEKPEQIRALASPIRHEIGDHLAARGPLSAAELARVIGRRPTAVYHHLRRLVAVGLVRVRPATGARGRPALLYETVAPRMRLARAARSPRNRSPLARAGVTLATQVGRDYSAGFQAPHWTIEGKGRNHWFFRSVVTPSPARLARINQLLDDLAQVIWEPDPEGGPPITIAWFQAPLGRGLRKGRKSR